MSRLHFAKLLLTTVAALSTAAGCTAADEANDIASDEGALSQGAARLTCAYKQGSPPNVFGMRTFVTMFKTKEKTVVARLDRFGSFAGTPVRGAVSETRELTFHKNDMAAARLALRANPSLWKELFGEDPGARFTEWEATIACSEQPEPAPIVTSTAPKTCGYDATSGKPNPLGTRSFISIANGVVGVGASVIYEQLPSNANRGGDLPVTVSSARGLSLITGDANEARRLLRDASSGLAGELLGDTADLYPAIDATLKCQ